MKGKLLGILNKYNQGYLLEYWNELSDDERQILHDQIINIDFELLNSIIKEYILNNDKDSEIEIDKIEPPEYCSAIPKDKNQITLYQEAIERGEDIVSSGKVAAFSVAGGQGTRLGYNGPKGTFPITPVMGKSLFQYFAEVLSSNNRRFGTKIPWYIMTSPLNYEDTRTFFERNNFFGLDQEYVKFLIQGTMPAIDYQGKILLANKHSIAFAPNGHGGALLAMQQSGALDDMKMRGIEYISYFQVDNPLVNIINPLFIGFHDIKKSEMSSMALKKRGPFEKLGNFCIYNGKLKIIEYSDLPIELAEKRDRDGKLIFDIGSPAIHIINRDFVERLTIDGKLSLPWHRAKKKIPSIINGLKYIPDSPNGFKLETFIFDALPMAKTTFILESIREEEFAPLKNAQGEDSIYTCRNMLIDRDGSWIESALNVSLPRTSEGKLDCIVELSRATFLDKKDIASKKYKFQKLPKRGDSLYYE